MTSAEKKGGGGGQEMRQTCGQTEFFLRTKKGRLGSKKFQNSVHIIYGRKPPYRIVIFELLVC